MKNWLNKIFGYQKSKKQSPVEWRVVPKKTNVNTYNIHFMAFLELPWQLYTIAMENQSSLFDINYNNNAFCFLYQDIKEVGTPIEMFDHLLEKEVRFYKVAVSFIQRVKLIVDEPIELKGTIDYIISDGHHRLEKSKQQFQITLN